MLQTVERNVMNITKVTNVVELKFLVYYNYEHIAASSSINLVPNVSISSQVQATC